MHFEAVVTERSVFHGRVNAHGLGHLLNAAGLRPHEALRTNEAAYRQYVADKNLADEQLIRVMTEHPELIQRPIVVRGNKAVWARPARKLAELGIK